MRDALVPFAGARTGGKGGLGLRASLSLPLATASTEGPGRSVPSHARACPIMDGLVEEGEKMQCLDHTGDEENRWLYW